MTHPNIPSTGELALEDRAALRRVAGLSTELADVSEVEYRQLRLERVVLVGVWTDGTAADADASLAELAALAETAGSEVLEGMIQRRDKPDPSTYIGSGKAQELREIVVSTASPLASVASRSVVSARRLCSPVSASVVASCSVCPRIWR